ncbi:hypothetical protein NKG94_40635 [Micromonospora sp. M12]
MSALLRMRLAGFLRTGRAVAPLLAGLITLGTLYGGSRAQPAEAYGVSAVVLFLVLAWQTKILLDVEPDVQRRLAQVTVGVVRERVAGLLAAGVAALVTVAVALLFPWLVGGVSGPVDRGPAGAGRARAGALGASVGRTRCGCSWCAGQSGVGGWRRVRRRGPGPRWSRRRGARPDRLGGPWLAPPIMAAARTTGGDAAALTLLGLTVWALAWSAAVVGGYLWRRRAQG